MRTIFSAWLILVLFLCAAGPAMALGRRDLEVEVESLRKQVQTALELEEKYQKQVQELDTKVSELLAEKRAAQAQEGMDLLQMQKDMATLREQMEELQRLIKELNERLATLEQDAKKEFSDLRERVKKLELKAGVEPGPGADSAAPDYQSVYQLAMDQFNAGKLDAAQSQFEAFLKAYPNTDLSDNAMFMIGECYFNKGNYEKAIVQYDEVRKKFPQGNKTPNALFKMALAFDKIGERDTAKLFLKDLIKRYPASPEAQLATEQLEKWK